MSTEPNLVDIFTLERMEYQEVPTFDFEALLDKCDPDALADQRGAIFPNKPLENLAPAFSEDFDLRKALGL